MTEPAPECKVTPEQYPQPRPCAFAHANPTYDGPCHLNSPAECRAYVATMRERSRRRFG